jgi:hypothetical protein
MANSDSVDGMIEAVATYGPLIRSFVLYGGTAPTAATANSGAQTGMNLMNFTIPALTSPVTSAILTKFDLMRDDTLSTSVAGYKLELGQLTISGNVFAAGSTMPTRTIAGTSVQTASLMTVIEITTALTATTPVITITYTDQDGNTGQTASVTLPTNAALGSTFLIYPHLANGDTGVRAVTNISTSAGTAGVLKVYGFIPVAYGSNIGVANLVAQPLVNKLPLFPFVASDILGIYSFGPASTTLAYASIYMIPETGF